MDFDSLPTVPNAINVIIGTRTHIPGYIHVDADASPLWDPWDEQFYPVDVVCDARKIDLPNDYADFVFSSECIEHIEWKDYRDVLKEWCRIVKPGGMIRVETIDFLLACNQIIEGDNLDLDRRMSQIFYAEQTSPWDYHKVGITHRMLEDDFISFGFEVVNLQRGDECGWLRIDARKPNDH